MFFFPTHYNYLVLYDMFFFYCCKIMRETSWTAWDDGYFLHVRLSRCRYRCRHSFLKFRAHHSFKKDIRRIRVEGHIGSPPTSPAWAMCTAPTNDPAFWTLCNRLQSSPDKWIMMSVLADSHSNDFLMILWSNNDTPILFDLLLSVHFNSNWIHLCCPNV